MRAQDRESTRQRYRKRWDEYGNDSRTLGWNKDCQWVRFEAAFEGLRAEEFTSIVDVGCGFGDLLGYLLSRGWHGRYTGVDLVDEFIGEARRRYASYPDVTFICGDVQDVVLPADHDMAVAIGVFNTRVSVDSLEFIRETFEIMWTAARKVLVCDFLSDSAEPDRRQESLYYANPREVYELGASRSRRVMMHHAYMPFEFQVKVWHDDTFDVPMPVFRPYRHLASAHTEWRKRADLGVKPANTGRG